MEKNFVTNFTAMNATETVKTLIGTYTVPQNVSKLVEVGMQICPAGLTTLEDVSAILELESDDMSPWGGTQQFVSDPFVVLGATASGALPAKIHDCDIPVTPGSHIKFSVTFNVVLTINPSVRCFGKFR